MKVLAIALLAAALVGCATQPQKTMDSSSQPLVGKDIHTAFDVLGYPASERVIAGDQVYTWTRSRHVDVDLPTTNTTTGDVDGTPFNATTTGTETMHLHYHCKVELITDASGVIKHYQWEGNRGGCKHYATALGKLQ